MPMRILKSKVWSKLYLFESAEPGGARVGKPPHAFMDLKPNFNLQETCMERVWRDGGLFDIDTGDVHVEPRG